MHTNIYTHTHAHAVLKLTYRDRNGIIKEQNIYIIYILQLYNTKNKNHSSGHQVMPRIMWNIIILCAK